MKEFEYYNRYGLEGTKGRSYPSNARGGWNHESYHHTAKGQMYEITGFCITTQNTTDPGDSLTYNLTGWAVQTGSISTYEPKPAFPLDLDGEWILTSYASRNKEVYIKKSDEDTFKANDHVTGIYSIEWHPIPDPDGSTIHEALVLRSNYEGNTLAVLGNSGASTLRMSSNNSTNNLLTVVNDKTVTPWDTGIMSSTHGILGGAGGYKYRWFGLDWLYHTGGLASHLGTGDSLLQFTGPVQPSLLNGNLTGYDIDHTFTQFTNTIFGKIYEPTGWIYRNQEHEVRFFTSRSNGTSESSQSLIRFQITSGAC